MTALCASCRRYVRVALGSTLPGRFGKASPPYPTRPRRGPRLRWHAPWLARAVHQRTERQIMPIPVRPSAPRQARQRSAYRACSRSVHPTRTMSSSIAFAARHRWWGIRIIRPSPYMGVRTIGYAHTRPGLFGSPHPHAPRLRSGAPRTGPQKRSSGLWREVYARSCKRPSKKRPSTHSGE
jgi:hypothetical protein